MYDYNYDGDVLEMFMPGAKGSLCDLVEFKRMSQLQVNSLALIVLRQMLKALEYLHNGCGRVTLHRDIKPQNILYNETAYNRYHFYLADFGLAKDLTWDSGFSSRGAHTMFMSPAYCEKEGPATPAVDIWALFATIVYIFHPELRARNLDAYYQGVHERLTRLKCPILRLEPFKDMAEVDPSKTPTATQLLRRLKKLDLKEVGLPWRLQQPWLQMIA